MGAGETPERRIGERYRLVRLVGGGGMGEIWEAERVGVGRRFALKLLKSDRARDDESRARFLREIEAAGRIVHDNVCEVLDFGLDGDDTPYYVMPLLAGKPLSSAIASDAPFPLDRALDVALQALDALDAAHAAGFIHRDLKPDNVFLARIGDRDDFVKVLDFGISKVCDEACGRPVTTLTQTGAVLGTPHYMAPEQARGDRDLDRRVDVFAVGLILYEMLTGRRAFEGETSNEVLWNLWNAPLRPPRAFRPDLPGEVEKVVLRALARDRRQRHDSAGGLRADLLRAMGREAGTAGSGETPAAVLAPPSPSTTTLVPIITTQDAVKHHGTEPRRTTSRLGLVSAILGVVVLAGLALLIVPDRSTPPPEGSPPPVSETPRPPVPARGDRAPDPVPTPSLAPLPATATSITLHRLPPLARVTVDGSPVEGETFETDGSGRPVEVVIRAPGYRTWSRQVDVVGSSDVVVRMQRRPDGQPSPGTEVVEARPEPSDPDTAEVEGTVRTFGWVP
jgi:serine/threonine-protein kinase